MELLLHQLDPYLQVKNNFTFPQNKNYFKQAALLNIQSVIHIF